MSRRSSCAGCACARLSGAVCPDGLGAAGERGAAHLYALRRSLEGWLAQPPFRDWELTVLGPAPASVAKINDRYRYRLTLAAQNTKEIRAMVAHLVRCAQTDKENKGVSVSADVNPLD